MTDRVLSVLQLLLVVVLMVVLVVNAAVARLHPPRGLHLTMLMTSVRLVHPLTSKLLLNLPTNLGHLPLRCTFYSLSSVLFTGQMLFLSPNQHR